MVAVGHAVLGIACGETSQLRLEPFEIGLSAFDARQVVCL